MHPGKRNSDPHRSLACGCLGVSGGCLGIVFALSCGWTGGGSKACCCKEQYCIITWNVRSMNQGKLEVIKQKMARVNVNILGVGRWWPAAGLGALTVAVHAWDLLREVSIIFITSTIVWPQINSRERTQLHPSTENCIKDLLSMAPPIRTRPSIPLSQSISSGNFHKPLILLHQ